LNEGTNPALQRFVRNSTTTLIARVSGQVARLVVIMVLARYLGKSLFGDYTYILALVGSLQILADFGLNKIAVREIAKQPDKADAYFGNVLLLKVTLAFISLIVLVVLANVTQQNPHTLNGLYLYGAALILSFFASTYFVLYRAFERMQYEALLVMVERGIHLGLIILLVRLKVGFVALFWASMIASAFKFIIGTWLTIKKFTIPRIIFNWDLYKMYIRNTLPVGFGLIINSFSLRVDTILLGFLSVSESVGIFSGPYRIVDTVGFIATVLITALFPVISRRSAQGNEKMREIMENSIKALMIIALPASLSLAILARPVVILVLGNEFPESIPVLQVLALVVIPTYFRNLLGVAFIAAEQQIEYAYISGGVLLINVIIDLVFIPQLGYWGACIGAISAEMVRMLLCFWRIQYYIGSINIWSIVKRLIIPSFLMTIVLWGFSYVSWILAAALGAIVYFVYILLFCLSKYEKTLLMQTVHPLSLTSRVSGWFQK
jgi:O-antigen/teichoic acid export membrane protein